MVARSCNLDPVRHLGHVSHRNHTRFHTCAIPIQHQTSGHGHPQGGILRIPSTSFYWGLKTLLKPVEIGPKAHDHPLCQRVLVFFNETHGGDSRTTQTSSPQPSTAVEQLSPQATNFGIVLHPPPRQSAGRLWFTMVQTLLGTTVGPSRNHHQTIHRSMV